MKTLKELGNFNTDFWCEDISFNIFSINTILTIKLINILDKKEYKVNIKTIFNVAVATLISNIGPLYSIIINKKEKHKTER